MFTQVASLQTARLGLIVLAFAAFIALAAFSAAPRFSFVNATETARSVAPARFAQPTSPSVFADGSCGNGAYITGDLAGDASPASVYASLCPTR